jgi:hypothetical protein
MVARKRSEDIIASAQVNTPANRNGAYLLPGSVIVVG